MYSAFASKIYHACKALKFSKEAIRKHVLETESLLALGKSYDGVNVTDAEWSFSVRAV